MVKVAWFQDHSFCFYGCFKIHARHSLTMVGAMRTITARQPYAAHMAASHAVTPCHHAGSVKPAWAWPRLAAASRWPHARLPCLALLSLVPPWPRYAVIASPSHLHPPAALHRCLPCRWPYRCWMRACHIHGIGTWSYLLSPRP